MTFPAATPRSSFPPSGHHPLSILRVAALYHPPDLWCEVTAANRRRLSSGDRRSIAILNVWSTECPFNLPKRSRLPCDDGVLSSGGSAPHSVRQTPSQRMERRASDSSGIPGRDIRMTSKAAGTWLHGNARSWVGTARRHPSPIFTHPPIHPLASRLL